MPQLSPKSGADILSKCPQLYWTELLSKYQFAEKQLVRMTEVVDLFDILKTQKNLSLDFLIKDILRSPHKKNHNEQDLDISDVIRYQPQHKLDAILKRMKELSPKKI